MQVNAKSEEFAPALGRNCHTSRKPNRKRFQQTNASLRRFAAQTSRTSSTTIKAGNGYAKFSLRALR
jgi:hypothetical protein